MERRPQLESILQRLHIPEFMYLTAQPDSGRIRRLSRQERRFIAEVMQGPSLVDPTSVAKPATDMMPDADLENSTAVVSGVALTNMADQN